MVLGFSLFRFLSYIRNCCYITVALYLKSHLVYFTHSSIFFIMPWRDAEKKRKQPRRSVLHKEQNNNIPFTQLSVLVSMQTGLRANLLSWLHTEKLRHTHVQLFISIFMLLFIVIQRCVLAPVPGFYPINIEYILNIKYHWIIYRLTVYVISCSR